MKLKIVKTMINNPVFRHEVKTKESLKSLSILRFAQGTNFSVTDDEWAVISGLITSREKNKRWDYLRTDVQDALDNLRHNVYQTWKGWMMKTKRLRRPSPTVTRIGAAEPIVDESELVEKKESQKIKDQAAAIQRIANLLNGKKP